MSCSAKAPRPEPVPPAATSDADGDASADAVPAAALDPCLISISEASALSQAEDATFVDVRPPHEFERYRIPGALNIPLYAIKAKPFLRHRGLIIVGEEHMEGELVRVCRVLRTLGFERVAVAHGGLRAWWQAGQPIAGDPIAIDALRRLPPRALHSMRHARDWLLVGTPADLAAARELLPGLDAVAVPSPGAAPSEASLFQQRILDADTLLVITADGDDAGPIESALRQRGHADAFVLDGGLAAYRSYLTRQQRLARHARGDAASDTGCPGAYAGS